MKLVATAAALFALFLVPGQVASASSERLANYFTCSLKDGKTRADLMAFKASYEEAVAEAGLEGYELRLQFPLYWGERKDGVFVWEGSWKDYAAMDRISKWFRASEWPARFQQTMTCGESSLWQIVD
ncbi:MAG: hypothetical protein ACQGVC_11770 [Myxococcota bacterium]